MIEIWKFYGGKEKVKEPPGQDDLKLSLKPSQGVNTKYKKHSKHKMGTYFTFHIYFNIFTNPDFFF